MATAGCARMRIVIVTSLTQVSGRIGELGGLIMGSKCPVCGGTEDSRRVIFTTLLRGKLLSIEQVPALVCRQCGEETFSADTVKRTEALLASQPTPSRVAEVPVYTLDAA